MSREERAMGEAKARVLADYRRALRRIAETSTNGLPDRPDAAQGLVAQMRSIAQTALATHGEHL